MTESRQAVAGTGLLVAAVRAAESARDDRLFSDPFADRLAGETGRAMLAAAVAETGERSTVQIVVRTRFWDEALLNAAREVRQIVILAAGMDARAYRLDWPDGTAVFELDQSAVMAAKTDLLADEHPRCRRVAIGIDLADDWPAALRAAAFDPLEPTAWLIEGLLQYLDEHAVRLLFERVDELSSPNSTLLYDVAGKTLLESPMMAPLLMRMAEQGSPWLFGTDEPGELAGRHGWDATVTDIAHVGRDYDRWLAPASSADDEGAPRGYFVAATLPPS